MNKGITLTLRDLGHFASAFVPAFFVMWKAAGDPTHLAALWALAPAAGTVAFRQVFPNPGKGSAPGAGVAPGAELPRSAN